MWKRQPAVDNRGLKVQIVPHPKTGEDQRIFIHPRTGLTEYQPPLNAVPMMPPAMIGLTGNAPTNNYSWHGMGQLLLPAQNYQDVFMPVQVGFCAYSLFISNPTDIEIQISGSGDTDYWNGVAQFYGLTNSANFVQILTPIHILRLTNNSSSTAHIVEFLA